MSYIQELGATEAQKAITAFFTGGGTPSAPGVPRASIAEIRAKQCMDAGVPPEFVASCVEGLRVGVPFRKVISTLQQQASGAPAAASVPGAPTPARGGGGKILLIGGAAAAGLLLLLLLRKKKGS